MLVDRGAARRAAGVGLLLAMGFWLALMPIDSAAWAGTEVGFPRPAALEPNVQFWVKVFTQYSSRDFILHDRDNVSRIYQVFHLPGSGTPTRDDVRWANAYLKAKYAAILDRLASGAPPSGYEDQRVARMFHGRPPAIYAAYATAAEDLRVQQGLSGRFREGLLRSRYYRSTMERIFREAGLPPELVTLAEVESGFYPGARSSAGAVGIWQFTRATGRRYLTITRYRDDRLSPIRSTEAAAQLLRYNYDRLGSWPLAITAYNYGTAGMARAAEAYGNNFTQVFKNYDGPHFGFASKNYYAEFLAALQVHRHEDQYFPGIQYESVPPPRQPKTVLYVHHRFRHRHYYRHRRSRWPMHHRRYARHSARR